MNFGSLKLPLFGLDLFFEDTIKFILKKKKDSFLVIGIKLSYLFMGLIFFLSS